MSDDGPAVDLARGDRVGGYRVLSILGHGKEGVAASALDEFLDVERVLKAYPATQEWTDRLRFVSQAFAALADLGVCPRPVHGGVACSSRHVPMAFLVVEHRVGKPLDELIQSRRWTKNRARRLVAQAADRIAKVHLEGWWLGDFEGGNNIVLFEGEPLFIDIGLDRDDDDGPDYAEDFSCLADIALKLGAQAGCDLLIETSRSLVERSRRRLDRRSFSVWLKKSPLADL